MKGTLIPIIASATFLALAPVAVQAEPARQGTPDRIQARDPGASAPIWVSSRSVVGEDGKLDPTALDKAARDRLERYIANQKERRAAATQDSECDLSVLVVKETESSFLPRNNLHDLIQNAQGIFSGRIVAAEQGFFSGDPATLLKLQVDQTFRSSEEFRPDPFLYIRYPHAAFKLADTIHCAKDPRFPKGIEVGDRVLIFSYSPPVDASGTLLAPEGEMLIVENQRGQMTLPRRLKGDLKLRSAQHLEEVEELIRQQMSRTP